MIAQIAREFEPEKIILFGSYAYGSPTADSDVDLLVVLPYHGKAASKAAEILTHVRTAFPVDIIVRTASELRNRIELNDFFMREVVEKGRILFASDTG